MSTIDAAVAAARSHLDPPRLRLGVAGGLAVLLGGFCLLPVVTGGWWLGPSIVAVSVVVAGGALQRMLRVPVPLQPIGSVLFMLAALGVLFTPHEMTWRVLPSPGALSGLRSLLAAGRADAWATVPPAGQTPGLLLIVTAGIALVAVVVDTLAAGLDLPALTIIPLGGLYAAPWVVGAGFPPSWSFVVFIVAWLLVLRASERARLRATVPAALPSPWVPGAVAVAASLVACLWLGQWLPASGDGHRVNGAMRPLGIALDPIVSLRRAVLHSSGTTVLTYRTSAAEPDYLRLAVLETFDGRDWRAAPSDPAAGRPARAQSREVYDLAIGPLVGPVIPSPAGTGAARTSTRVAWTRDGLPVRADGSSVADTDVKVVAGTGRPSARSLTLASRDEVGPPAGFDTDPTQLVGPELGQLAREVTAAAATPYEQAMALQSWFTDDGGFRYSTADDPGPSGSELATFLSQRSGYCEQFASTMALMARTLGIPARVVVGFTQGRLVDGTWTVADSDAHAWPELWMGSAGWVRFEPTPRRDSVSTPAYARPTQVPAPSQSQADPVSPSQSADTEPDQQPEDTAAAPDQSLGAPLWLWLVGLALLGLACLPSGIRAVRRRARRGSPTRPGNGVDAYNELVDTMIDLRLGEPLSSERRTVEALLSRIGASGQVRSAALRIVAAVEAQRYGPPALMGAGTSGRRGEVGTARADRSAVGALPPGDLAEVDAAMRSAAGWRRRLLGMLAPRSLWR